MSTRLAYLNDDEARALAGRASRAAGMPVSIHHMTDDGEGPRIVGAGSCEACRFVTEAPDGPRACRTSRTRPALTALKRGRTIPFVCHAGFGCVCGPVFTGAEERFVLTAGPFCPAEGSRTLRDDFARTVAALDPDLTGADDIGLDDIRIAPADVATAIAEWTAEALSEGYERASGAEEQESETSAPSRRRAGTSRPGEDPYRARAIAAALTAGESAEVRSLVQSALEETAGTARTRQQMLRARAVAVAAAALEAAGAAGLVTATGWRRFAALLDDAAASLDAKDAAPALATAVMRVLSPVRRTTRRAKPADAGLQAVERIVTKRIADRLTLGELAAELGKHPTAITHQLQRKFGMSFTQYVGRLRVDKAKELLRRTKLGMSEVGKRVGVGDQSNFSKLFKKFEGLSPVEYRARFGKARQ